MNCIKGTDSAADAFVSLTSDGERRLGFLSVGFGIIADVDVESERLRYVGELRFTLWALRRIGKLRRYRARLSYLPVEDATDGIKFADEDDEDQVRTTRHEHTK